MAHRDVFAALSARSARTAGVFRGADAVRLGMSRKQLTSMRNAGVIERVLPDTYRMTAVARSPEQRLRAALLWAGPDAAAAGASAGAVYGLTGVHAPRPEI